MEQEKSGRTKIRNKSAQNDVEQREGLQIIPEKKAKKQ